MGAGYGGEEGEKTHENAFRCGAILTNYFFSAELELGSRGNEVCRAVYSSTEVARAAGRCCWEVISCGVEARELAEV